MGKYLAMQDEKKIFEDLLQQGHSKASIHNVLHTLMLAKIKTDKSRAFKKYLLPLPVILRFHQISGKALCLLQTLFAKKPKNPV